MTGIFLSLFLTIVSRRAFAFRLAIAFAGALRTALAFRTAAASTFFFFTHIFVISELIY
jgi:hypothetical protein